MGSRLQPLEKTENALLLYVMERVQNAINNALTNMTVLLCVRLLTFISLFVVLHNEITAPGRRQRITDELRRARAATGGWIDTDFYKDFVQVSSRCT